MRLRWHLLPLVILAAATATAAAEPPYASLFDGDATWLLDCGHEHDNEVRTNGQVRCTVERTTIAGTRLAHLACRGDAATPPAGWYAMTSRGLYALHDGAEPPHVHADPHHPVSPGRFDRKDAALLATMKPMLPAQARTLTWHEVSASSKTEIWHDVYERDGARCAETTWTTAGGGSEIIEMCFTPEGLASTYRAHDGASHDADRCTR